MVQSYVIVGCSNRWKSGSTLSWHRFPTEKEKNRRRLWLSALKRKDWNPKSADRVCGRHFLSGNVYFKTVTLTEI